MPIRDNREYRAMPLMTPGTEEREPLLKSDYYVEGYATTFDEPYLLFDDGESKFFETVARSAFDDADMTDVIFLHDHEGKVFARNRMKPGKEPTLVLQMDDHGLRIGADLGITAEGRDEYEAITSGLIWQMSFAFTVADDEFVEKDGVILRTLKRIRKVYDVSSVSRPANPGTVIDAATRSAFDGFIDERRREVARAAARARQKQKIRIMMEVNR